MYFGCCTCRRIFTSIIEICSTDHIAAMKSPYCFSEFPLPDLIRQGFFKVLPALFLFALTGPDLAAQTWQRVIGHIPPADPFEILPTVDGGVVALIPNRLMVKLDADGDTVWTKSLPDSLGYFLDAKTDPNGVLHVLTPAGPNHNRVVTLDNSGNVIASVPVAARYDDFCTTGDGFLLVESEGTTYPDTTLELLRINLAGDTLWYQQYSDSAALVYGYDVIRTSDGGFVVSVFEQVPGDLKRQRVIKTDADGTILWTTNAPTIEYTSPRKGRLLEDPDGSLVLMGPPSLAFAFYAIRLSAGGQVLLEKTNFTIANPSDFAPTTDGGYLITGYNLLNGVSRMYLHKLDHDFNVQWKRFFAPSVYGTSGISIAWSGGNNHTIMGGINTSPEPFNSTFAYVIHPDSLGNVQQNLITGHVRHDTNDDCIAGAGEAGLGKWLVTAGNYSTLTENTGKFEFDVGIGSTAVTVYPPMNYWQTCPGFDTVTFSAPAGDTTLLEIPVTSIADCPFTEINIGTNWLRPCFNSYYTVQYCNLGTLATDSASALIVFPPEIDFISAGAPVLQESGDSVWFDLGALAIGECSSFQITVFVSCDSVVVGQTLCTEAHIFPDSICYPVFNWSGAEVKVSAQCLNDQEVYMTIRNIGTAPTDPSLEYLIIEDQVVLHQGMFQLDPGEKMEFTEPADGSFWRISADQEPNFPAPSMPAAWLEGCGGFQSLGYVNSFYFDDAASSVDIECRVATLSCDPNDKQATPEGYGNEHFIEPGTELTYLIRFQNTGTDTAFNVILRDTLDAWLDPASVRPGASSHPYEFEIVGPGILKVWFKNIQLPDSNVNEVASHGFFQYRVQMKPGIPLGTQIFNRAAIYFDFNEPVITNYTFHTIGEDFYTVAVEDVKGEDGVGLTVAPNPFRETARFVVEHAGSGAFDLQVVDVYGRTVRREKFKEPEFLFRRNNLPPGTYFFEIRQNGRRLVAGKMTAL